MKNSTYGTNTSEINRDIFDDNILRSLMLIYCILASCYVLYSAIILRIIHMALSMASPMPQIVSLANTSVADLLYVLASAFTAVFSMMNMTDDRMQLGDEATMWLPAKLCSALCYIRSWFCMVSLLSVAARAIDSYVYICQPLQYDHQLMSRLTFILAPAIWLIGLLASIGTIMYGDIDVNVNTIFSIIMCDNANRWHAYIAQGIICALVVFCVTFSSVGITYTAYQHIDMDTDMRRLREHLSSIQSQSVSNTVQFHDPVLAAQYSMDAEMFCIPERTESSASHDTVDPHIIVRPKGPSRLLRHSVCSSTQLISPPSSDTDIAPPLGNDTVGDLRKISTMARYGSADGQFRFARPVELYFRISTCTAHNMEDDDNDSLDSVALNVESGDVPRIDVISPTTIGHSSRSIPSTCGNTTSSEITSSSDNAAASHQSQTQGMQTMPDDVPRQKENVETNEDDVFVEKNDEKNKGDEKKDEQCEGDTKRHEKTSEKNDGDAAGNPEVTANTTDIPSDVMDLKIRCSVSGEQNETHVSMDTDVNYTVNNKSQGKNRRKSRSTSLDTEMHFSSGQKDNKKGPDCSLTTTVEIQSGGKGKHRMKKNQANEESGHQVQVELELDNYCVLNEENLSQIDNDPMYCLNRTKNNQQGRNSVPDICMPSAKKNIHHRHQSLAYPTPEAWQENRFYKGRRSSDDVKKTRQKSRRKSSINRQITKLNVVAEAVESATPEQGHINNQQQHVLLRASRAARTQKINSAAKIIGSDICLLIQWLPIGIYVLCGHLIDSNLFHLIVQFLCYFFLLVGSASSLFMVSKTSEDMRKQMNTICLCRMAQVEPIDSAMPDEQAHGALPL